MALCNPFFAGCTYFQFYQIIAWLKLRLSWLYAWSSVTVQRTVGKLPETVMFTLRYIALKLKSKRSVAPVARPLKLADECFNANAKYTYNAVVVWAVGKVDSLCLNFPDMMFRTCSKQMVVVLSWHPCRPLTPQEELLLTIYPSGAICAPTTRADMRRNAKECIFCGANDASMRDFWADWSWWAQRSWATSRSGRITYRAACAIERRDALQVATCQLALTVMTRLKCNDHQL